MFAMANAVKMVKGDVATLESRLYEVATGLKITLPYEVQEKSVRINGFEEAAEAAEGKFSVVITTTGEGAPNTVITFAENDVAVGDTLRVAYRRRVNGASVATVKTNSTTAKGALYAHWPVYSSGTDCTESSVKGYLHLFMRRGNAYELEYRVGDHPEILGTAALRHHAGRGHLVVQSSDQEAPQGLR